MLMQIVCFNSSKYKQLKKYVIIERIKLKSVVVLKSSDFDLNYKC